MFSNLGGAASARMSQSPTRRNMLILIESCEEFLKVLKNSHVTILLLKLNEKPTKLPGNFLLFVYDY